MFDGVRFGGAGCLVGKRCVGSLRMVERVGKILAGAEQLQAAFVLEIARGKGLQRVVGHPAAHEVLAAQIGERGNAVHQFAQKCGRGAFGIGADVAADVGQIQGVPRGQHSFQKQVAVVVAPCAVAGLGQLGNQVERGGFGLAWEDAVVQAEQADGVEGQRAHRHHAAKGDAAAQEAGFAGLVQEVLRVFAGGVGMNLFGELCHIGLCLPVR